MEITQSFQPKNQSDWRHWLSKNHSQKNEIWVIFFKKRTGKQTISYSEALDQAVCFGWIDGIEKSMDNQKYAIRFTPRKTKGKWSEYNVKRYKDLLRKGLVDTAGKLAFKNRGEIYTVHTMSKEAVAWHLANKMPKNPTLDQRITWHHKHKKICGCRPVPKSLESYF